VSADGSVIGGTSVSSNGGEAFIWSEARGMVGLGDLRASLSTDGKDVSDDGRTVLGVARHSDNHNEAFLWTESNGMLGLGGLPGSDGESYPRAISGDGRVVIGLSNAANGESLFMWDEINGMRRLHDVLIGLGLQDQMNGWSLWEALDLSYDGSVIVGFGRNPAGEIEAWRAVLTPVPEPSTLSLAGVGLALLCAVRLRRKPATHSR
jgi:probable HAF family extracellular repeat protein